jgi:hypothetical protein
MSDEQLDTVDRQERSRLAHLEWVAETQGWDDKNPQYKARLKAILKEATDARRARAHSSTKKLAKARRAPGKKAAAAVRFAAPKSINWDLQGDHKWPSSVPPEGNNKAFINWFKSALNSEDNFTPDPWQRGGPTTINTEKFKCCRFASEDRTMLVRIIKHCPKQGMVRLQTAAHEPSPVEEEEEDSGEEGEDEEEEDEEPPAAEAPPEAEPAPPARKVRRTKIKCHCGRAHLNRGSSPCGQLASRLAGTQRPLPCCPFCTGRQEKGQWSRCGPSTSCG